MKKPIIFILDKGQTYQSKEDLAKGEIPLNTGLKTHIKVWLKEGAQNYKLDVITTDVDGSNPVSHVITMDSGTEPIKVQKYKNLSFHLISGSGEASYTFEAEFV